MIAAPEPTPPCVEVGRGGLRLVGRDGSVEQRPLICGAMHYFHHRREDWARCLDNVAELGLSIVDTYVPWIVHEREPGSHVFDSDSFSHDAFGDSERPLCRNLGAFLRACHERGLGVLLRPGPQINAELTGFGFPWRILSDEACLARGSRGNLVMMPMPPRFFPAPSYASQRFLDQAQQWLAAVAAFVAPHVWPDGPVLALQVDNELTPFFRDGAYDLDYHPDAIALFSHFVQQRYQADRDLPAAYGGSPARIEPPRRMDARSAEELVPHLDWIACKEWLVQRALGQLADALQQQPALRRVPLTHNVPVSTDGAALSLAATEARLDVAGIDLYLGGRDYQTARRAVLQAAGSSRLPFLAELGWGGWPWWFPQLQHDQVSTALTALMHGIKGINFYMAVERDRWFGAPIDAAGRPRADRFETTRQLVAAIRESRLPELSRAVSVAVMRVRDYQRLAVCSSLLDPAPPLVLSFLRVGCCEYASDETFGLSGAIQCLQGQFGSAVEEALSELPVDYHLVDSELDLQRLGHYRLLIVPAFDFIDRALLERLRGFVAGGGTLALGPLRPTLDERMRPLTVELPPHLLLPLEGLVDLIGELVDRAGAAAALTSDRPEVELASYGGGAAGDEDQPTVIFAANRGDSSCTAAIRGVSGSGRWVWDALSGDPVDLGCLHLEAQQVCMLRLCPARPPTTGGEPGR